MITQERALHVDTSTKGPLRKKPKLVELLPRKEV
jgi:hypothetical protein